MIAGSLLYWAYRRHQGLPLTKTVKVQSLEPLGVEEVEYSSVLVAFDAGDPFNEEMVATAKALGARKRRAIHVLTLIAVPTNLPLEAELEEEEAAAQSKIEQAKLICGQRVTGSIVRVRPGQSAKAIVQLAREIGAEAIVMQLRYRAGVPTFSNTISAVLAKRPCRVIVAANPERARAGIVVPVPA
jgi:nucleotide-binding universal stress UspA family protein